MNSEFKAKLEGVKLSEDAKKRIASGLQNLVLHELAQTDNKGDLVMRSFKVHPTNGIVAVEQPDGAIHISQL